MNDAVTKMMDNLDRNVLRDLQVRSFGCKCLIMWLSVADIGSR